MKARLSYQNKGIEVEDIQKCSGLKKFSGLMFKGKDKAKAMLFDFKNPKKWAIHSLFCPDFIAIWIDDKGKVVDWEFIMGNHLSIRPKKKFSKLLEVPLNKKYSSVAEFFLEEKRKV